MTKIEKIEEIVFRGLKKKRFRIYVFFLVTVIFLIVPTMPYLNIFVDFPTATFLIIFAFLFLFDLSVRVVIGIVALLFFICLIYQLLKQPERADTLGNYIYGIVFVQVIKGLVVDFLKTSE